MTVASEEYYLRCNNDKLDPNGIYWCEKRLISFGRDRCEVPPPNKGGARMCSDSGVRISGRAWQLNPGERWPEDDMVLPCEQVGRTVERIRHMCGTLGGKSGGEER